MPKSVIATPPEAPQLSTYLARLHQAMQPNSKQEYLLRYPGFAQTFGLPLDLPERGHDGWVDLPETFLEASVEEGAAAVSQVIRSAIDRLAATTAPNVVLIFVPARWKKWERYKGDAGAFDLHDFVKAYCVQRGIATQFIREETLTKQYRHELAPPQVRRDRDDRAERPTFGGTEVWVLEPPLVDEAGKVVDKDQYTAQELACFEDATMIAMAGPIAEAIYWPHRTYDEVLMKNESDEASIVTITRKIWRDNAREVEMDLCNRVRSLLEQEWAAVGRLAESLEKSRTLDGPAAVSAIGLE